MRQLRALVILVVALLLPVSAWADATDPIFAGVWAKKDPGGTGALYYDQSWDQLVGNWKTLGQQNQYLADVEAYRSNGKLRFAAVWRVGPGNGGLLLAPWKDFVKTWGDLQRSQDLIDLEIIQSDGVPKFLGVWRDKQGPARRGKHQGATGSGALFVGLSFDDLVKKRAELGNSQYLADVETFVSGGKRLFAGVWRVGPGNGALYLMKDWSKFADLKRRLNQDQQMLDFEMFQGEDGAWNFLGVWRLSDHAGPLHASKSTETFEPLSAAQFIARWKENQTSATLIAIDVTVPMRPPLVALKGDTSCKYGDVDCNRCVADVPNEFRLAFEGGHRPWIGWDKRSWRFSGNAKYPPDGLQPEDAFFPYGEGKNVGIVAKHVQGFVRTNSSRFPYAGSHSHKTRGSIFFVERNGNKLELQALYKSTYDHPSGVAVLGDGLFVAENNRLRWIGISAAGDKQDHGYDITVKSGSRGLERGGGGIGLAKLYDGTTLLVVSAPGGGFRKAKKKENREPRYTRFYRLAPDAFRPEPEGIELLGEWKNEGVSEQPDKPMGYSENISVVTECKTGRIYTVHTTGDYALDGDGYWHLSRVDGPVKSPRLTHIQIARQAQENESCHHRSSATVYVDKDGHLAFLCSERAVIKWHPHGAFEFKEGTR